MYKERISLNSKPEADALLTKNSQVTLGMRYADCVPILLFDPVHQVAGIAHSGWRGTVKRVSAVAVRKMENEFGSNPTNILAAIGPSICAKHYQVGLEVIEEVESVFGKNTSTLIRENGSTHFDLWSANKQVLSDVGVSQIEIAELCTACDPDNWFSYRAEDKRTGGFAAIIGLKR
jgi:YfiH family protein